MWAFVAVVLGGLSTAAAQSITPATCPTNTTIYDWSYNTLGQSPCEITSILGGVCSGGTFTVPALPGTLIYVGPTLDAANPCRCNTVFYSLLSACANCQGHDWERWTTYDFNCSTVYPSLFPFAIPSGTSVPHYAYLDVTTTNQFNDTAASIDASSNPPESTFIPTSTSTSTATSTTQSHTSAATKSSHAGAIAGGVIGGIVLLALIAGLVFWFLRRRRASVMPPSQAYGASPPPPMGYSDTTSGFAPVGTPKLYNPSDPSTFPSSMTTFSSPSPHPDLQNRAITPAFTGSSQPSMNPGPRYTGAPEL